jgi:hypothetical protein
MANATLPRLDRTARGAGIVTRHDVIPVDSMDGFYQVRDTATGSGKVYLASIDSCSCPDHTFRGSLGKHIKAARAGHDALTAYAASWDALTQPRCPMSGCSIEARSYYVGGRGYVYLDVCSGDATHSNRRPRLEDLPEC